MRKVQKNHKWQCVKVSSIILATINLTDHEDAYASLPSTKSLIECQITCFSETRTEVPIFSSAITASATVPAVTCSYIEVSSEFTHKAWWNSFLPAGEEKRTSNNKGNFRTRFSVFLPLVAFVDGDLKFYRHQSRINLKWGTWKNVLLLIHTMPDK